MKVTNPWGVPNQFELRDDEGNVFFQSYETIIAKISRNGEITLNTKWDHSRTTSKYRNLFLGEDTKTTARKVKEGLYKVEDLNKG